MALLALEFVLRRPASILMLIACLTAPAIWSLSQSEFAPSIVESFVDEQRDYVDAQRLERLFDANPDSLIWLASNEGDQLFTRTTLNAIRRAALALQSIPGVKRVIALPNQELPVPVSRGVSGTAARIALNAQLKAGKVPERLPRPQLVLPRSGRISDGSLQSAANRISRAGGPVSSLISRDGQSHVMLIELENAARMHPTDQIILTRTVIDVVRANGLGRNGVYCSGLIPLQAFAFDEIGFVLQWLLPVGGILISIAVMLVFRRVEVILVTLLIAAISVVWGIAAGILVFGKISVLMAAVPLMVLVISTADVIHLISSYTAERDGGATHQAAVRRTFLEVGGACVLTSITTFVGFASLVIVPSNTVRQFGLAAAAGVASALLLSVLLVPLFLDLLSKFGRPVVATASASRMTKSITTVCFQIGTQRPRTTLIVFLILLAGCAVLTSQIRLDPDLSKRFSSGHPMALSTEFFQQQFGGVNTVEILLKGSPAELLSPTRLSQILEYSRTCESEYACGQVNSIAGVLSEFLKHIDYRNLQGLPESAVHARTCIETLRLAKPQIINSLISQDNGQLRILARIDATSYLTMLEISDQLAAEARRTFGDKIEIIQKGSAPLVGRAVRDIIRGHLQGFGFCFTTIFFLIAIGMRSLKLSWVSVIPNLTPLLFLGGLVAVFSEVADSDILGVATLGLGLAVDDTIHFLSRFRLELRGGQAVRHALQASMEHTGLAIIRTTLILSTGFLPFAFSSYSSISMLGTYLIAVLFSAVLADLILLPAIITLSYRDSARA